MSRGRKKRTLRDLSIEGPTADELELIVNELRASTDRNIAILASSGVEWQLARLIIKKLPNTTEKSILKLLDNNGPLSTLYATTQLGFALGLYDKDVSHDLEIIRRVRNSFAHSPRPITFRTAEISEECQKLILGKDEKYVIFMDEQGFGGPLAPKKQFVVACVDLHLRFLKQTLKLAENEMRRKRYRMKKLENALH